MNSNERYNVGGSPEQNAALASIMFAACAALYSDFPAEDRLYAAGILAGLLEAAEVGGFTARDEFIQLVSANTMTPVLEAHGYDIVLCIGGAAKFFELLDLITTPAGALGAPQ